MLEATLDPDKEIRKTGKGFGQLIIIRADLSRLLIWLLALIAPHSMFMIRVF